MTPAGSREGRASRPTVRPKDCVRDPPPSQGGRLGGDNAHCQPSTELRAPGTAHRAQPDADFSVRVGTGITSRVMQSSAVEQTCRGRSPFQRCATNDYRQAAEVASRTWRQRRTRSATRSRSLLGSSRFNATTSGSRTASANASGAIWASSRARPTRPSPPRPRSRAASGHRLHWGDLIARADLHREPQSALVDAVGRG